MSKVAKMIPDWHAQVASELNREFAETNSLDETARKRRARLGLMFLFVKSKGKADGSIPHGGFRSWMQAHCAGIPIRTAARYLTEAKSICELLGWQICQIGIFEVPPHKLLLGNGEFSGADRAQQKRLVAAIDEQASFQAITRYIQTRVDEDDEAVPRAGRRAGEGAAAHPESPLELVKVRRKLAVQRAGKIYSLIGKLGLDFTLFEGREGDTQCELLLAQYEKHAALLRAWLNQPKGKRDVEALRKLWETPRRCDVDLSHRASTAKI